MYETYALLAFDNAERRRHASRVRQAQHLRALRRWERRASRAGAALQKLHG
jgi:hypothetical protein